MKAARIRRFFSSLSLSSPGWRLMNVFELTRALVDIESITNNEERVGHYLYDYLRAAGRALRRPRRAHRSGTAPLQRLRAVGRSALTVTLSTHMDTVPPFFASREDGEHIWGRGACDAKGIIACHDQGRRGAARSRRAQFRPAVRGGRGAQQRRRLPGRPDAARLALHRQRRAHRKQAGARFQGRAAL